MTKKKLTNSAAAEQAPLALNSAMAVDVSNAESDDDMTLEELSQQALDVVGGNTNASVVVNHVQIGKAYFAFTQTFGFIGTVIAKDHFGIHFSDTVWVAHAGFMTGQNFLMEIKLFAKRLYFYKIKLLKCKMTSIY